MTQVVPMTKEFWDNMKKQFEAREELMRRCLKEGWFTNVNGDINHPRYELSMEGIGFFIANFLTINVFLDATSNLVWPENEGENNEDM